jgi:hypothetical protein
VIGALVFLISLAGAAEKSPAVLEMSRSSPGGIVETVAFQFSDGVETVVTTSNRLMPDRPEVGIFKRKSASLFNRMKTLKAGGTKGNRIASPHDWRVRLFGQEIPAGEVRVDEAARAVAEELKTSSSWKAFETARVELKTGEAIFRYSRPGSPVVVERQNIAASCRPLDGRIMCTSKLGYVFVK